MFGKFVKGSSLLTLASLAQVFFYICIGLSKFVLLVLKEKLG